MIELHEIIYMKSFEEPWWMLEGWEKDIVSRSEFNDPQIAKARFDELANSLSKKYKQQKRKGESIAFWNEGDIAYCEDCEEELQVYHGILWLKKDEFTNKTE